MLGLPRTGDLEPGSVVVCPRPPKSSSKHVVKNARHSILGSATLASVAECHLGAEVDDASSYRPCQSVVARNSDRVKVDHHVVVLHDKTQFFGTVREILACEVGNVSDTRQAFATIHLFDLQDDLHSTLKMPTVMRSPVSIVVSPRVRVYPCDKQLKLKCFQ